MYRCFMLCLATLVMYTGCTSVSNEPIKPVIITKPSRIYDMSYKQHLLDVVWKVDTENARGSGVRFGKEYIITAAHVVQGVQYALATSYEDIKMCTVVYANELDDIAVLKMTQPMESDAGVSLVDPTVGMYVDTAGFVQSDRPCFAGGCIEMFNHSTVFFSGFVYYGCSGGAVFEVNTLNLVCIITRVTPNPLINGGQRINEDVKKLLKGSVAVEY